MRTVGCNEKKCEIRSAAAKEIYRHLGSESTTISQIQRKKWKNVEASTRREIKTTVMSVLKNLKDKELIESVTNLFETVIFTANRYKSYFYLLDILKMNGLHVLAYITAFKVIANISKNMTFPRQYSLTENYLSGEFVKFMSWKPEAYESTPKATKEQLDELKCLTSSAFKGIINSLDSSSQINKGTISIFMHNICDKIVELKVLYDSSEEVCTAVIHLCTHFLSIDDKNFKNKINERKTINEFWENRLENDLYTQLQVNLHDMGMASDAVKNFLRTYDLI